MKNPCLPDGIAFLVCMTPSRKLSQKNYLISLLERAIVSFVAGALCLSFLVAFSSAEGYRVWNLLVLTVGWRRSSFSGRTVILQCHVQSGPVDRSLLRKWLTSIYLSVVSKSIS